LKRHRVMFFDWFQSTIKPIASHLSVGDKASIMIAIASAISAIIILAQAVAMGIQTKYSNKLIDIELRRDRQANSVSAWIEVATWFRPSLPEQIERSGTLVGYLQVKLLNQSSLPIYNVKPLHLGYWDSEKEFSFFERTSFSEVEINVQPPARGEINWFGVSVSDNRISIALDNKTPDPIFRYEDMGMSQEEVRKLSIAFSFRCSDGSQWERRIDGSLNPLGR